MTRQKIWAIGDTRKQLLDEIKKLKRQNLIHKQLLDEIKKLKRQNLIHIIWEFLITAILIFLIIWGIK